MRDHVAEWAARHEAWQRAQFRQDVAKAVAWTALCVVSLIAMTYVPHVSVQPRDWLHTAFLYYNAVVFALAQWPRLFFEGSKNLTPQTIQIGMFIGNAFIVWLSVARIRELLPEIGQHELWQGAMTRMLGSVRAVRYDRVLLWLLQAAVAGVIGNFAWTLMTGQR